MIAARPLQLAALAFAAAALGAAAILWQPQRLTAQTAAPDPAPNTVDFYTHKVQPIFKGNCYRCHGGMSRRGGLKLDTQADLRRGGKDGSVITPGHPEQSLLIALIRHEGPAADPRPMPPRSKISDADIAAVTAWVKAGAIMPADTK